ncbi:hypothetical protein BC829DRAFT_281157 [Chytridium lagenaria]|nr:hypothetical protein BC829DRAFT_281157 [Chytridium lagenaria]
MKLSLACLTTVPVTPEIQAEIDFVNGSLLLLNTYAIVSPDATPPLPIQIRLAEDRLVLIANLISFFPKNRIPDRSLLVDIGQKLTQRTGAEIEVRVRGMVATWALNHGNIDLSLKICLEMIELSATKRMSDTTLTIEEEWRVALRVVLEAGHVISLGTRRELLTFCLEWCDSKSINEVLEAARVAELSQALKSVLWTLTST